MKLKIGIGLLLLIIWACGSSSKMMEPTTESRKLDEMIDQKSFEIVSEWAMPQMTNSMNSISNAGLFPPGSAGSRITLIGNPNYLRVSGDSVSAYLPYYGERQMGGGYNNTTTAIKFKGIPKDFEITKDTKDQSYAVHFEINDKTENYNVNLKLFPNLKGSINVNSSQRFQIRYSGDVAAIAEE